MQTTSPSQPSPGVPPADVSAVVTAMTDAEAPYLRETVVAVLADTAIGQAVVCVAQDNDWAETSLGALLDDPRLELLRIPMCPLAIARNRGVERVALPWTAFCDGDDVWCPGKTAIQRTVAERTGCVFVGADHYLTDEQGHVRAFGLARYIPMPSSWLVRTDVLRRYPFVDVSYEDGDWWYRTTGLIERVRCPRMLIRYRVRAGSLSGTASSKRRKARLVALGGTPLLGWAVLAGTAGLWFVTRRHDYLWHRHWAPAGARAAEADTRR